MQPKITLVATEAISACDLASITMLRGSKAHTAAGTDKTALHLDQIQDEAHDGPCLAAIRHRGLERVTVRASPRENRELRAIAEKIVQRHTNGDRISARSR